MIDIKNHELYATNVTFKTLQCSAVIEVIDVKFCTDNEYRGAQQI